MEINFHSTTVKALVDQYKSVPKAFTAVDPRVLVAAGKLSGNNWHRVVLGKDDKSLVVYNKVMW